MSDEASSTTTWETIVQNYKTRAVCDGARIDELRQSTEHWHDTAQMLKRQRDTAEEERDGWKIRAMKAEQGRQAAKAEADHWKAAWALAVSEAAGVHAECEALRNIILWALGENGEFPERPWGVLHTPYPFYWWRTEMRKRLDAAMAVQPTTEGGA